MAAEGLDATTVEIITQDFNMNAFLQGDIDAAQAMTYNEYAQLLEAVNPDTGELYQPTTSTSISYEDTDGAMLQDAIWADTERLADDAGLRRDTTVKFLKAVIKGWVYARGQPARRPRDIDASPPGSQLGPEPPAVDDQRDQQAHLAVAGRHRHRSTRPRGTQTVEGALSAMNETGRIAHHRRSRRHRPTRTSTSSKALDELKADGVDVTGDDFEPIEVTLTEGGN